MCLDLVRGAVKDRLASPSITELMMSGVYTVL